MARIGIRYGALLILIAGVGCSAIMQPRTRLFAPIDPDISPQIYLSTNREREAMATALEQAGISVTSVIHETPLTLAVRIGNKRAFQECGVMRNVTFDLRHDGVRIAVIKGRGWIGSCPTDILQDMSTELAHLFDQGEVRP